MHYQQITGYETILVLIIQFLAIDYNKNKTDGHTNEQTIIIEYLCYKQQMTYDNNTVEKLDRIKLFV